MPILKKNSWFRWADFYYRVIFSQASQAGLKIPYLKAEVIHPLLEAFPEFIHCAKDFDGRDDLDGRLCHMAGPPSLDALQGVSDRDTHLVTEIDQELARRFGIGRKQFAVMKFYTFCK